MKSSTTRRQIFAKEYLADRNATQAAIRAGYSVHTAKQQGSRLLTKVDVQAEIAFLEAAQQEADHVDRSFVLAGLRDLALNASTESNRVRSYELLGKYLRMFVEQTETSVTHDVTTLAEFTIEDLRALRASQEPVLDGEVRVLN
jgi:phage terminase small subunit